MVVVLTTVKSAKRALQRKKYKKACLILTEILKEDPNHSFAIKLRRMWKNEVLREGHKSRKHGNWEKAGSYYRDVLHVFSDDKNAKEGLRCIARAIGKQKKKVIQIPKQSFKVTRKKKGISGRPDSYKRGDYTKTSFVIF